MKPLYTLFFSLFLYSISYGQITLMQSDAPVAGESWIEITDDRLGIHTIGPAGANQNWNYSTNFLPQDTDYVNFVSPATLTPPINTYFPGSNLAFEDPVDSTVAFLNVNSTGIYVNGFYVYSTSIPLDSVDVNPDELIIPFPFTYNDTRNNNSKFEFTSYDSTLNATIKISSYKMSLFNADGYGSLTTPQGSFSSVLRIKQQSIDFDSTFIDTSGTGNFILISTGNPDTSYSYQHVQNGAPAILFTLDVLANDMTVEEAYYTSVFTTAILENEMDISNSIVYPNPIILNDFNILISNNEAHVLKIHSINGKEMYSTSVKGINKLKLSLPFANGVYLFHLYNSTGKILESGKFVKH